MSTIDSGHSGIAWRKAGRSVGNGECVEISAAHPGVVSIRDSKNPEGPVLTYPAEAFRAFLYTTKRSRNNPERLTHRPACWLRMSQMLWQHAGFPARSGSRPNP